MDPALHAELGGAELDRLADPRGEVLLGDLVGVGRAPPLAEAAEGAADDADVGEVDVAVDDEGDPLAGQLGPQLVGGDTHLLDHLRPGLGEERGQLVLAQLLALAALGDRPARQPRVDRLVPPAGPDPRRGMKLQYFSLITSRTPCSIHSGSMYCGIDAEPLGQRIAPRRQLLPHLVRAGKRLLRRDVVPVRRQPPQVRRPRFDQLGPASDRFGGTWIPTSGINRLHSWINRLMSSIETGFAQVGNSADGGSADGGGGDSPAGNSRSDLTCVPGSL